MKLESQENNIGQLEYEHHILKKFKSESKCPLFLCNLCFLKKEIHPDTPRKYLFKRILTELSVFFYLFFSDQKFFA